MSIKTLNLKYLWKRLTLTGGPYARRLPDYSDTFGVCMAKEHGRLPNDEFVPTVDFSTPPEEEFQKAIDAGLEALFRGQHVYAGCMGGIGRTGFYIACILKILEPNVDPLLNVRARFKSHAVETTPQEQFVMNFDTSKYTRWYLFWLAVRTSNFRLGFTKRS